MKGTNINQLDQLKKLIQGSQCKKCEQIITQEEIKNNNFSLFFSENSEAEFVKYKDEWRLEIFVKEITHEWDENYPTIYDCPEVEKCVDCFKKFRDSEIKKGLGENKKNYYCLPCFNKKYGDYLKERSECKELTPEQKEVMLNIEKAINEHLSSNYHNIPGNGHYGFCKGSECKGYKETIKSYGY